MNNPRLSKRKKAIIRIVNYALMTIAVISLSIVCIFLILGYQFNTQKGTIDQGGLVQFRSFPTGAKITLDKQVLNFQTPGKQNVAAGNHTAMMQRAGYHDWSKSFSIKPGELRWLNYARFIPTKLTTTQPVEMATLSDALPSPNRQWMAVLKDSTQPVVTMYDLRDEKNIVSTQLTLPVTSITRAVPEGVTQTFSLVEWDFGARFILLKRTVGDTVEFIRLERSDSKTATNITEFFNLPFGDMHFSGTSGNNFFATNGTDLRHIDVASKLVSQPLVTNVKQFKLYKEKDIAYISVDKDVQTVGVMRDDRKSIVRTYPAADNVQVDLSSFSNNDYLALTHNLKLEILKDPLDNADSAGRTFAAFTAKLPSVGWLDFSNNGRFVVVGNGLSYETYDIETDEHFTAAFDGQADASTPIKWLDDYYLTSTASGSVVIAEFDGGNSHVITSSLPGFSVTVSDNGNYLYSFGKTANGFAMQQTKLNLSAN